jgi:hypothetical protein
MKLAILDDTYGVVRTLPSARLIGAYELSVWQDHTKEVALMAQLLADTEVFMLLRERTPILRAAASAAWPAADHHQWRDAAH